MNFTTNAGRLYADGAEIQLRGISHFGFNADILIPQFLWSMSWRAQLAQIQELGFNAVRVPFTPDTLYIARAGYSDARLNPDIQGLTPLEVLDLFVAECDRLGLYTLLDFHSPTNKAQYRTWFCDDVSLTYNGAVYTSEHWIRDLVFVATRYADMELFIGIDLYNEPHDVVRWDAGDANYDNTQPHVYWRPAVEAAAAAVLAANPNLLVFVQGTESNWNAYEIQGIAINLGENFQSQWHQPLAIPADKLVLSPHTYGPDVYAKASFSDPSFPANLAADWDTLFGQFHGHHAVVPGEWGGKFGEGTGGQADAIWQNAFVDYMLAKGITSSFYWCYTPNSGDTGGILADDLSVREDKMAMLRRLWDAPEAAPPDKLDRIIELLEQIEVNTRLLKSGRHF